MFTSKKVTFKNLLLILFLAGIPVNTTLKGMFISIQLLQAVSITQYINLIFLNQINLNHSLSIALQHACMPHLNETIVLASSPVITQTNMTQILHDYIKFDCQNKQLIEKKFEQNGVLRCFSESKRAKTIPNNEELLKLENVEILLMLNTLILIEETATDPIMRAEAKKSLDKFENKNKSKISDIEHQLRLALNDVIFKMMVKLNANSYEELEKKLIKMNAKG